ncbi:MAG: leucyl/phenylalanyl-tRNA--protein transferase [Armatimonadetes bacterium]|nr:leucyl/phenylalanyl-tRNA--protein transferase [Armatimonadota bacterium]
MHASLQPQRLIAAYCQAAFPMAEPESGLIYWFRPDPRAIMPLDGFHVSRSLAKTLRRGCFTVTINSAFEPVMRACADRAETWISEDFIEAYCALHRIGVAHSVEVWADGELAGGTYGVALGGAFMAESMFHTRTDASKVALAALVDRLNERGFSLMDVQYMTDHLATLGAVEIPGRKYERRLAVALATDCTFD